MGEVHAPVAPRSFGWVSTRANSCTPSRARSARVAAGERAAALDEPVGHGVARAGLACEVCLRVCPLGAPAGVEEDGVAWLGINAGQMVDGDHVTHAQAQPGHVDQPATRHELRDRLGAEPFHSCRAGELRDRPAVVAAFADLQVAERIEVRTELHRR